MAKSLVTHINPHLDDIAAIWLIKKFFPEYKDAKVEFISADKGKGGLNEVDTLYIGVGMGKYDEHKGDVDESAMSLVWKDIKSQNLGSKDNFEEKAIDEMVKWNTLYDTAKMPYGEWDDFSVEAFIRSYENSPADSLKTVELGAQILDRILPVLIRKQHSLADWDKRIDFESKWGKSMGIGSSAFKKTLAYRQGYQVVIQHDPKDNFMGVTAPGLSDVDLEPVYLKLKEADPEADWFLHQGHKMVLCGAGSAPDVTRTKLTLDQVIEIVKSI